MVTFSPRLIAALVFCALAVYALSQYFDPQRLSGRTLTRCVSGLCMLCLWNLLLPFRLGVNPLSSLIAGTLGLPGLGLLAVLKLAA